MLILKYIALGITEINAEWRVVKTLLKCNSSMIVVRETNHCGLTLAFDIIC